MLRLVQLRLAVGLFVAGILALMTVCAWAFSQQTVSPAGGNYDFGDPDKHLTDTDNHNSGQGSKPFGSSGPTVQFGIQQGPVSSFGRGSGYNGTPDPYYQPLKNGN